MTTDPTADQAAALAAMRTLIQGTLLIEYRRRITARIEASPEEHCAALADAVAGALTLRAVVPTAPDRHPRAFLLHPRHGDPLPGVELPGGVGVMLFEDWEDGIAVRASSMAYLISGGYHGARIEWAGQQPAPVDPAALAAALDQTAARPYRCTVTGAWRSTDCRHPDRTGPSCAAQHRAAAVLAVLGAEAAGDGAGRG
ncbi:hypothetical protein [Streptomyces sp. DH8]|uniref:hypothetical protein n=1 Tax=Streptomyces sp. DH8 TaxID=2857008 RepID=UPI001E2967EF|nr:hypothetical protein [Streptomyces sp. DH8]